VVKFLDCEIEECSSLYSLVIDSQFSCLRLNVVKKKSLVESPTNIIYSVVGHVDFAWFLLVCRFMAFLLFSFKYGCHWFSLCIVCMYVCLCFCVTFCVSVEKCV
jgi:hypothetical protein